MLIFKNNKKKQQCRNLGNIMISKFFAIYRIQSEEGYSQNGGKICVGLSYEYIRKLLLEREKIQKLQAEVFCTFFAL